jgi:hypothetical protein
LDATSAPATPKAGSSSGAGVLQAPADSIRKLFNKNG